MTAETFLTGSLCLNCSGPSIVFLVYLPDGTKTLARSSHQSRCVVRAVESVKVREARRNEVAYCGGYCRTCHWYSDALRKPAGQLLGLVKANFEVAGWIKEKGGSSTETIKGLEILSKSACAFNCNGGSGWTGCPVRKCCTEKSIDFCFECADFPCDNWDEKGKHSNVFNKAKKERLQEMKSIGVEEWIKKQWE